MRFVRGADFWNTASVARARPNQPESPRSRAHSVNFGRCDARRRRRTPRRRPRAPLPRPSTHVDDVVLIVVNPSMQRKTLSLL